jgi:tetratricopeptide (TPR) repeat protein
MTQRQKSHIFVSYSRSDRIAVDKLVRDLRARHYVLWMDVDPQGIEPGEDWRAELVKQMSGAEAVLACGSPDFLASPYCQEEIAQAKRENKPIYPVLVRRLNAGQSLEEIGIVLQYADLTANYESEFKRLIDVLPRPPVPTAQYLRYALRTAAVVMLIALFISGIALAVRVINPAPVLPTEVIIPTATPSLDGYDLKVVVAPFALDAALTEADRRLAADLVLRLSRDMQTRLQALDGQSDLDIGFLGIDSIPPLLEPSDTRESPDATDQLLRERAAALALNRNFDMVFYGTIDRTEGGQLRIAPRLYIPPERFTEALEMTGSQAFGASIVLTDSDIDTAYETSAELRGRVQAMVYTVQGISEYIAHRYSQALQAFTAAAEVPNWTEGRETLYLLQGNVYLQLARDAVTACTRAQVLQQLDLAESEYDRARPNDDPASMTPSARPDAALAEVFMLRATWSTVDEANPCEPQQIDLDTIEQALTASQRAADADDFAQLEPALQSAVIFTQARAQATLWYAVDTSDALFTALVDDINAGVDRIISLHEANPGNLVLTRTVFEARFLRGIVTTDYTGTCGDTTIADFTTALELAANSDRAVERSRQMFVAGALGQCYELNEQTDRAIEQYRVAYDIARTLTSGTQDRDFYGCKLQRLTGDENSASVTTSCEE